MLHSRSPTMSRQNAPVLLYYHPSMEDLARSIASVCAAAYMDQADTGALTPTTKPPTSLPASSNSASLHVSASPSSDNLLELGNNAGSAAGTGAPGTPGTPGTDANSASTGSTALTSSASLPALSGTASAPKTRRPKHAPEVAKEVDLLRWRQLKGQRGEGRPLELCEDLQWGNFEDGFPNVFINNVKEMHGRDVLFLASFHSPAVIFEQLSVIYAFPRYLARSFTLILPYFPTGTMERVDIEGQIVTAKSLATLLSAIPFTAQGPPQIVIFDIHALQERFYFSDQVIPRLESAIPLLLDRLKLLPDFDKITIAFPDEGAHKRFHTMFEDFPTIICTKVRDGNNRIVTIKEGDAEGRHVVIVDDLVKTGGTLVQCAKAIKSRGADKISFYVTHAVFPLDSWRRFVNAGYEYFWFTDSCPAVVEQLVYQKPFELLSLSTAIVNALLHFDLH